MYSDDTPEDRLRFIEECSLVEEVTRRMRCDMVLARVVIEVLVLRGEAETEHIATRPRALEPGTEGDPCDRSTQIHDQRGEVRSLLGARLLQRHRTDSRAPPPQPDTL